MASPTVVDWVESQVGSAWNSIPVFMPNRQDVLPSDGSRFLAVQFPVAISDFASLGDPGNRLTREEGAFRLVLHVQRGEGAGEGLALIEQLRTLFRAKESGGIVTYEPSPPTEHDNNDEGKYYALSTAVPYEYDVDR